MKIGLIKMAILRITMLHPQRRSDRLTEKEYRLIEGFQPFNLSEYRLRSYAQKTIGEFIHWCVRFGVADATSPSGERDRHLA